MSKQRTKQSHLKTRERKEDRKVKREGGSEGHMGGSGFKKTDRRGSWEVAQSGLSKTLTSAGLNLNIYGLVTPQQAK